MTDDQWWYAQGSVRHGPVDQEELLMKVHSGSLSLHTPVWRQGMERWELVSDVPSLAALADSPTVPTGATPPPLPLSPPTSASVIDHSNAKPWYRWFARAWLDFMFAAFLVGVSVGIYAPEAAILSSEYALTWVAAIAWIPLEASFLAAAGTTPGKYLLGLRVVSRDGRPLTFFQGLSRAISVFVTGCAALIPIAFLFTFNAQYKRLKEGREASWDERGGWIVVQSPLSVARKVLLVTVIIAFLGLIIYGSTDQPAGN